MGYLVCNLGSSRAKLGLASAGHDVTAKESTKTGQGVGGGNILIRGKNTQKRSDSKCDGVDAMNL